MYFPQNITTLYTLVRVFPFPLTIFLLCLFCSEDILDVETLWRSLHGITCFLTPTYWMLQILSALMGGHPALTVSSWNGLQVDSYDGNQIAVYCVYKLRCNLLLNSSNYFSVMENWYLDKVLRAEIHIQLWDTEKIHNIQQFCPQVFFYILCDYKKLINLLWNMLLFLTIGFFL